LFPHIEIISKALSVTGNALLFGEDFEIEFIPYGSHLFLRDPL